MFAILCTLIYKLLVEKGDSMLLIQLIGNCSRKLFEKLVNQGFFSVKLSYNRSNILKVIGFQFNFLPDSSVLLKVLEGSKAAEISLWLQRKAISCLGNRRGGFFARIIYAGCCCRSRYVCSAVLFSYVNEAVNRSLT